MEEFAEQQVYKGSMVGDRSRRDRRKKRLSGGCESNADPPAKRIPKSPKGDASASTPSGLSRVVRIELDPVESNKHPANKPIAVGECSETLAGKLRLYGFLKCSVCAKEVKSTASFYLHQKWCGRESETTVCPACHKVKKSMWMKHHRRICKASRRVRSKPAADNAAQPAEAAAAGEQPSASESQAPSASDEGSHSASNATEDFNECITCQICKAKLVNLEALKVHYMEQHTRVWNSRVPDGIDNAEALEYMLKVLGALKCQKCQKRLKSIRYYRFHVKWCGRKYEVQTCKLCNTIQPAILLRRHQKVCRLSYLSKRRNRPSAAKKSRDASAAQVDENLSMEQRGKQRRSVNTQAETSDELLSLPPTLHPADQTMSERSLIQPTLANNEEESRNDVVTQPITTSTPASSSLARSSDRARAFNSDYRHNADSAARRLRDAVASEHVSDRTISTWNSEMDSSILWEDVMGGLKTNLVSSDDQCYAVAASRLPLEAILEINRLMSSHGVFTYYLLTGGMLVVHPENGQDKKQVDALLKLIQQVLAKNNVYVEIIPKYNSFNATLCGNGIGATVRVGEHSQTVGMYMRHKGVAYFVTAGHCFSPADNDVASWDVPVRMSSHVDVPGITPGREEVRLAGQFRCFGYDPPVNAAGESMLNHVDIMICPMPSFYTELGTHRRGLHLSAACYTCRTCYRHPCSCGVQPDVAYSVGSIMFFKGKEAMKLGENVVCMLRAEELVGEVLMCCPREQQVVAGEVLSYGNAIAIRTASGRTAVMNNVLLIKSLGRVPPAKGDSGSVWVNPKTGEAVAITCAMGEGVDVDGETVVSVWLATLLHACLDALCYAHKPTFNHVGEFKALAANM